MIQESVMASNDDQAPAASRIPARRPIAELNTTMTLMKKIEETKGKAIKTLKVEGQTDGQEVIRDHEQVLAYKNLPNIRGKL